MRKFLSSIGLSLCISISASAANFFCIPHSAEELAKERYLLISANTADYPSDSSSKGTSKYTLRSNKGSYIAKNLYSYTYEYANDRNLFVVDVYFQSETRLITLQSRLGDDNGPICKYFNDSELNNLDRIQLKCLKLYLSRTSDCETYYMLKNKKVDRKGKGNKKRFGFLIPDDAEMSIKLFEKILQYSKLYD